MNDYFEKRALQIEDKQFRGSIKFSNKIKKLLKESEKEVINQINKFYLDFAIDNKISLQESRRLLNSSEFKEWRMSIKDYIEQAKELNNDELLKELEILSKRTQISRYEALLSNIRAENDIAYSKQLKLFEEHMAGVYKATYYKNIYNIQSNLNLYYNFGIINSEGIKKIMSYKNQGTTLSKNIWGNHRKKLFTEVQTQLARALATTKTNKEIAKEISKRYDVAYSSAERLVRTESNFYMNQASLDSLKETFADEYIYIATLDSRTSEICRELDGKVFKINEAQVGVNYPPMHPNCRSTTAIYIPDITKYEQRVMRNADGKSVVKEYMSYEDWENKYVK